MKMLSIVFLGIALGLSSLMLAQSRPLYLDITATEQPEADRMTTSLRADGYTVKQVVANDAQIHLRVGPYNSAAERDEARADLALKGIKSVFAQAGNADQQQDASASAPTASAGQQDAEAAALAKLGLSPAKTAPRSQAEIEAEALKAMQTNTEREAAEAEKRRLAAEAAAQQAAAAAQQAEADRLQQEIDAQQAAANAPPQQSTAASFLNALNGVIAAGTDTYAQQQVANQAANQARLNQIAALRAQQAQIEANRAAEQRRQQQVAQAIATPSATGHPQTDSSATCDDARDHLPPGSTRSAYQGCIPYMGTQAASVMSNRTGSPGNPSGASSSAITPTVSPQSNALLLADARPTYATTDAQGNTTLGVGTPKACAVTPSGSQLPLVPGTTAGTCNAAACRLMNLSVKLESKWTDEKKLEVVGTLTNNSLSDATCTWAFHKNGVWTDYRGGFLKSGESQGGPFSGLRSMGVDSSTIKYVCFEGKDPVDVNGKACNAHLQFTGMTDAGSDR